MSEENKKHEPFLKRLSKSIGDWASTDFHVPTFVIGSGFSSELISQLSLEPTLGSVYLADKNTTCLPPDLLIIGGIINLKSLKLIKKEYRKLTGKKYVVVVGHEAMNSVSHGYNLCGDLNDHVHVDLFIPGNPPSREDIQHALTLLKDIR